MREIDSVIVHCSATKAGLDFTAADIDRWHRERGFNGIGYHYIVCLDGKIEKGRDILLAGAHCKGWNERSIGICYIGGLDEKGRPADTRTNAQKRVLFQLIMDLQKEYNILQVLGHRDTSPDLNGDGIIETYEYVKSCPCFNVGEFMRNEYKLLCVLWAVLFIPLFLSGCKSGEKMVDKSQRMEIDSCSVSTYKQNAVEQSFTLENDSEITEESIERIVYLFSSDTLGRTSGRVVKTVAARKKGNEKRISAGKERMQKDSIRMETGMTVQRSDEMNTVVHKKRGIGGTALGIVKGGIFLFIGFLGGYLMWKWLRNLHAGNS